VRRGFTIIELLVCLAIIAILGGMLWEGIQKYRSQSVQDNGTMAPTEKPIKDSGKILVEKQ
jgi:prepilin-type N-terminal cleavage/methylation domain-containing protein